MQSMHIILTRPQEDSKEIAEKFKSLGFSSVISSAYNIAPDVAGGEYLQSLNAQNYAGLIITSRHAARALVEAAGVAAFHSLPLWVVGEVTANMLTESGFKDVRIAAGGVAGLVAALPEKLIASLLYLRGRDVRMNVREACAARGIDVEECTVYTAVEEGGFTKEAQRLIRERKAGAILFFSPRAVAIIREWIARDPALREASAGMAVFCLHDEVAAQARLAGWREVFTASQTNASALVAAVDNYFRNR